MNALFRNSIAISCLAILLTGCETVDSENVDTGDIIADIEGYRLTTFSASSTDSNVAFIVILREDTGNRPYIDLTGDDELELVIDSDSVAFTKEEDAGNIIRYLAEWEDPLSDPSVLTVRFRRGSGETFDSSITVGEPVDIIEPAPGFEWSPDFDELVVNWESIDPEVGSALVSTACTQEEVIENISERTFTVTPGTLVRDDTSRDTCTGYVELIQELADGTVATELNSESSFILDQATRIPVEAQY